MTFFFPGAHRRGSRQGTCIQDHAVDQRGERLLARDVKQHQVKTWGWKTWFKHPEVRMIVYTYIYIHTYSIKI